MFRTKKSRVAIVVMALLCVVCVISGIVAVRIYAQSRREEAAFKELSKETSVSDSVSGQENDSHDSMTQIPGDDPVSQDTSVESDPNAEQLQKYEELQEKNPDFFGWIKIDGTNIDYPVMYTPELPEYYLHRAFDKTDSYSGVPFMDGDCFSGCGNYIIYGHHMKNGTMFADLMDYQSESFYQEHPVIHFDTVDKISDYEVVAAFYSKAYSVTDTDVFRFYRYEDLTDEARFDEFMREVMAVSLYDTGTEAVFGDNLITLVTCSYHVENGRFVVVAREANG